MILQAWVTQSGWTPRLAQTLRSKKCVGAAGGAASHPLTGARRNMNTSKILTTTSLMALLAGFGALACGGSEVEPADQSQSAGLNQQQAQKTPADEAMRPEARGEQHGPHGGRGFGPPSPEKMIERFDANKNGQL